MPTRPAISASTGRARCRARTTSARSPRSSQSAPHVARVTRRSTSAWWWPRWRRAAPPASTTRRTTATRCTPARRAPARCAARPLHHGRAERKNCACITDDVGGAFGMKTPFYPEYIALLVARAKLGRPVHWQSTRSEAFISDAQARDTVTDAELALDEKGKFLALRMRHLCNQGAYVSQCRRQHQHQQFRALPARHVPHPEGRRRRSPAISPTRVPIGALSRRRAAGSELRARARRSRKPRASSAWIRCGCARRI